MSDQQQEDDDDKTCDIPKDWPGAPEVLETYDQFMKTGERWIETENFSKAIACFNIAEGKKKTELSEKVGKLGFEVKKLGFE